MRKVIIVGYGPGLGRSLAEAFSGQNYSIGLISRRSDALQAQLGRLTAAGVTCYAQVADAGNLAELTAAVNHLTDRLGGLDILIYNAATLKMKSILEETVTELTSDFRVNVAHPLALVKLVQPLLRAAGGSVLFTGAVFSETPSADFGSLSLGKAALKNLALQLSQALKSEGIFVGIVTIMGHMHPGADEYHPDRVAPNFVKLAVTKPDHPEIVY